jgi:1,4-dihydroxy-2-naphthoate octaprenyltransferase
MNKTGPNRFQAFLAVSRAPFLVLALVPSIAVLPVALVHSENTMWWQFALASILAVLAHVAVNALNEYEDLRSGLDFLTEKSPFNGGAGFLPKHAEFASFARAIALISASLVLSGGVWLAIQSSVWLMVLGIVGLALIAFYTSIITRHSFACLLAPGIAFGPIMVMGIALSAGLTLSAYLLLQSALLCVLVSALLLINQIPDHRADKAVGRKHLVISMGVQYACIAYDFLLLSAGIIIVFGVATGILFQFALVALLPLLWDLPSPQTLGKSLEDGRFTRYQAQHVSRTLLTPILIAIVQVLV